MEPYVDASAGRSRVRRRVTGTGAAAAVVALVIGLVLYLPAGGSGPDRVATKAAAASVDQHFAPHQAVSGAEASGPASTTTSAPPTTVAPSTTSTTSTTAVPSDPRPAIQTAAGYGCAAALAYLSAHAAPGFVFECPGNALGRQAMTCAFVPGVCPGERLIAIADACPAAYMNEAYNSQVAEGLAPGPMDPYGYCRS